MSIAAVPKYLGQDFKDASPGMRFGMFLELWGINNRSREALWTTHDINYRVTGKDKEERAFKDENKVSALKEAQAINAADKKVMQSIQTRQQAGFASVLPHEGLRLEAQATAPFTTGLGNEHPLENGFAFLNPYGLPYLPGSGVKGVLRQAARELASGEWGNSHGWSAEKNIEITLGKNVIRISLLDVLFGLESQDGDKQHLRGALTFWDVIPQIAGNSLTVEIMTPHQSHYYQQKSDRKSGDSVSPHDSGSPNPISFLTVPPGSNFSFFITCDTTLLARHAPHHIEGEHWKTLLQAAFEHAFEWLGFGAKTAVGYGAMTINKAKENEMQKQADKIAKEKSRTSMTEQERQIDEFCGYMESRLKELRGKRSQPNKEEHNRARALAKRALESTDWTANEKQAAAHAITEWLPKVVEIKSMKDEAKKLKLNELKATT